MCFALVGIDRANRVTSMSTAVVADKTKNECECIERVFVRTRPEVRVRGSPEAQRLRVCVRACIILEEILTGRPAVPCEVPVVVSAFGHKFVSSKPA